jgi:hypothetical protein
MYDNLLNKVCTFEVVTQTQNALNGQMDEAWANAPIIVTDELLGIGDGAEDDFYTLEQYVSAVSAVYVNGVLKTVAVDYTVSSLNAAALAKITFVPGKIPASGSLVTATYTHKDGSTIPCRLDEASGQEIKSSTGQYVKATHVLFIKASNGGVTLTEKSYRIVCESNTYNILLIKDAGGQGHHKELLLERVF